MTSTAGFRPFLLFPSESNRKARSVSFSVTSPRLPIFSPSRKLCRFRSIRIHVPPKASLAETASLDSSSSSLDDPQMLFKETFPLNWTKTVEGKITVRLDRDDTKDNWKLNVACNLRGKWILHWGITYIDEDGSEWDQPPPEMRPPGSITVKDYAIETPLKEAPSSSDEKILQQVMIDVHSNDTIEAIHFVLKEEETGGWYQHRGRDFKIPLMEYIDDDYSLGEKSNFSIWSGFGQISGILPKAEGTEDIPGKANEGSRQRRHVEEFYKEYSILKEEPVQTSLTVSVRQDDDTDKRQVLLDTDLPGNIIVHWGTCRDSSKGWEIPSAPHPPQTSIFRRKALRTLLLPKENGDGSYRIFSIDPEFTGFIFVLKVNGYSWINNRGGDFLIPLTKDGILPTFPVQISGSVSQSQLIGEHMIDQNVVEKVEKDVTFSPGTGPSDTPEQLLEDNNVAYTEDIINDIRSLVSDISSEKGGAMKSKEAQESILQEIEKLAAEAYGIFRSSVPIYIETISDSEASKSTVKIHSATGTGYEILCQGFNWESNKSGRWYAELFDRAPELASLGLSIVWLPPPTESVSAEGYMPKDLYNLNSRYGTIEELQSLVKRFHEVGMKVLGDVVLNHRCAHYQNQNGIWNIFGGRLNWDDRAVVADDPHFQGRGNKSSGDNFHAAPNIDHSQDFVRKDLKEWLGWLRKEIGYDGWRLDFVRGFWGGYVKDYMEASEPYFAVGEYWDSLSYTYGQMDHNQDAHRQRIVDWINATNGTAGAFDVTTKGILHSVMEKCEYWRLSDEKGKPPGVLGWWASRAVTFIENHDTGSTQGHWRFPAGKEMQGYAYILTHPGTPSIFYDHIFSHYQQEIAELIALRRRTQIHCRSVIKIMKAERDVYAACIDEKIMMKIGPGYYEPPRGSQNWVLALQGRDYKVWEAL